MHDSIDEDGAPAAAMEMPRYVSHKKVWALEIAGIEPGPNDSVLLAFADKGYAPLKVTADTGLFARYMPVVGDFYVVYADGYQSLSPRKAFIEGYKREA